MKIAKLPCMDYKDLTVTDALVKFYTDLGWDSSNQLLDPKKVKVSENDYKALLNALSSLESDRKKDVNLMVLNKGPSCGYADVKNGTVRLYSGWVQAE